MHDGEWNAGQVRLGVPLAPADTTLTTCQYCYGDVISNFNEADASSSTWADPSLHINGEINYGAAA